MVSEPANSPPTTSLLKSLGRALAHRNYRLFFAGQGVSLIGTWMTRVATSWLVYKLYPDNAWLLGVVNFASLVPAFILGPVAGVLVDRWNRHRTLVITQILSLVQSALLAVLAFSNEAAETKIWQIIVLSVCQGLINAFDMPARQVFLLEMVTRKEDVPNAIALNSSIFNGARLVGPSIAGVMVAVVGEGWCFTVDAVSYIAVVAALLAMRLVPPKAIPQPGPIIRGLVEGFQYAGGFAPIRTLLALAAVVSFMAMPYTVLLPIFAKDVLQGGPSTFGFLTAAAGLGALAGALYLAARKSVVGLGRIIVIATSMFGLGLIGFAASHWLWLSLVAMLFTGFGMMVQTAASNTILQTIVEEDKRGRVMSLFAMAIMGVAPFGALFAGMLADRIGAPATVAIGGVACLASAALFARQLPGVRRLVRPIYQQMGILPLPDPTVQVAEELRG